MKKIIIILLVLMSINSFAQEKLGLLIIAHGSPVEQWNQPVLDIKNQVKELLKTRNVTDFNEVQVALMEFVEPSIANAVKDMESKGVTRIFVLPLFIAPSGHTIYDIPTILGLYYDEKEASELEKEKTKIVRTNVKITIGPLLNYGNVIKDILLDKVKQISENPQEEALIILAHGDENFIKIWENLIDETGNYILGQTGIEYFDKAFVEVGQSFATNAVNPILKASKKKNKVIVIGMYLSMGIKNMANSSGYLMMKRTIETSKIFEGKNIYFAEDGLLPDKRIVKWIVDRSVQWLKMINR